MSSLRAFQKMQSAFQVLVLLSAMGTASWAHAQFFEDKDARLAILELRQQVKELLEAQKRQEAQLQKTVLELMQQNQDLKREIAQLRGFSEETRLKGQASENAAVARLKKESADQQMALRQSIEELQTRLGRIEPYSITLEGRTYWVTPKETESFNAAMKSVQAQNWKASITALSAFIEQYETKSPYAPTASFWLANAYVALEQHKEALAALDAFLQRFPHDKQAPDAWLSKANTEIALKQISAARESLQQLIKLFPHSEAGKLAAKRLKTLKL